MRVRDLLASLRRPWPKPLLIGLTALIASGSGYAVAATRPLSTSAESPAPVVIGTWIYENRADAPSEEIGELRREVLNAPPADVAFVRSAVVTQHVDYVGYQLMVLPAGKYQVYLNCRTGVFPPDVENAEMMLSIDHDGTHSAVNLACPSEATKAVMPLSVGRDTVFAMSIAPASPDDGQGTASRLWELSVAIGVFVVAV